MNEVRKALNEMHPNKSPGLDSMNLNFFQHCWDIVGGDLFRLVDVFETVRLIDCINDTNVVLILKKNKPHSMGDLQPISMCNVTYEVVT